MPSRRDVELDIAIGARVRFARIERDIGQAELGRKIGYINGSCLHRNERGLRGFTRPQLIVLAVELDVSIDWILTGSERKTLTERYQSRLAMVNKPARRPVFVYRFALR